MAVKEEEKREFQDKEKKGDKVWIEEYVTANKDSDSDSSLVIIFFFCYLFRE